MSRLILVYGQPASGKSYALRTLDPASTFIIDADKKHGLPWRGWKKNYVPGRNYSTRNMPNDIYQTLKTLGGDNEKWKHIKTIVVDGLNTTMVNRQIFDTATGFNKWNNIAADIYKIFDLSKDLREDLTVVINAHVKPATKEEESSVDHLKTPGSMLEKINLESLCQYVFYAKCDKDGNYFFETSPQNSTARSPEGCFDPTIPNDMQAAICTIEKYENEDDDDDETEVKE